MQQSQRIVPNDIWFLLDALSVFTKSLYSHLPFTPPVHCFCAFLVGLAFSGIRLSDLFLFWTLSRGLSLLRFLVLQLLLAPSLFGFVSLRDSPSSSSFFSSFNRVYSYHSSFFHPASFLSPYFLYSI